MVSITHSPAPAVQKTALSQDLSLRIELSRVILISAIVFHHIRMPTELNLFSWDNLGYLRGYLQIGILKTATSTLTIISGYLLFTFGFEHDPAGFIRKKFFTLVVPLVAWNAPLAIVFFLFQQNGHYLSKFDDLSDGSVLNWLNALLGLTSDPANAPLHFLRNIIACNVIALVIAGLFRRYAGIVFAVIVVAGVLHLAGTVVPRDDILIGFFLGAFVCVTSIDYRLIDSVYPITVPLFMLTGFLIFHYQVAYESLWWIPHRLLGFLAVWPLIGQLSRLDVGRRLSKHSGKMFFIFLSHYYVAIAMFPVFASLSDLEHFYVYFILAGPLTIAICVGTQVLAKRCVPSLLAAVTGGRV